MTKQQFFNEVRGRFFFAKWVKKDGTVRQGGFRLGVSKHTNGKGLRYDPAKYDLQVVWEPAKCDIHKGGKDTGYRMIKVSNVLELRCGDMSYKKELEPKFRKFLKDWCSAPEPKEGRHYEADHNV